MSVPRLLLQQTLRGSRTWIAVAAKHPIRLAQQTLGEGAGEGLACDAPLERAPLQSPMGLEARRGFLLSSALGVNVEVGTMGESITEGTIASIAKQRGEAVAVDDVLFQIETDKVTIDVRAPESGVLEDVMVKEDDTVTVGQVIARISAGDGQPADQASAKQEPASTETAPPADTGKAPSDSEAHADSTGPAARQPSIKFPPRRTPDGRQISALPAAEQKQYRGGAEETAAPSPEAQPRPDAPTQDRHAQSMFGSSTWYAGRERGTKLSQSRVLTEREMDMIELGGAPP